MAKKVRIEIRKGANGYYVLGYFAADDVPVVKGPMTEKDARLMANEVAKSLKEYGNGGNKVEGVSDAKLAKPKRLVISVTVFAVAALATIAWMLIR